MSFFAELKRRNVFRVGLFYLVSAWLILQVAETVLPLFDVPGGMLRGLVVLLAIGFVPVLVFSWVYELTPEGLKRDPGPEAAAGHGARTGRRLSLATIVIAALAIALLALDRLVPEPAPPAPAAAVPAGMAPGAAIDDASIAVLPFADLSPGGDQEYFSDGVAEEILNALVRVDGLQVASRTSSFAFKGQESLGIPAIAGQLGVRHVLEGSVRRAGDDIRITAQLIDAAVDRHLWSETYDRPLTTESIFAIQEEMARAIVAALVDSLGIRVADRVELDTPTGDLGAYDLYLQARALFQRRDRLDTADDLLQRALDEDPDFAKAWELRAAIQVIKREYAYSDLPQDELDRLGIEYARRALALEPASSMALATMAHIRARQVGFLRARHDLAGIISDLERALEIDPRNTSALNWLGLILGHVGRLEDALAVFRRCIEIEPLFAPCAENEYETLLGLGRVDEAWAHFQAALARGLVTHQYVNYFLLARYGQKSAFMVAANQSNWLPGWRRHDELYEAYRDLGADHSALVEDILRFRGPEDGGPQGWIENLLIPLGAYDLSPFPLLVWGEDYAGYRRSPQFQRFIRESGTLEYWREHGFPPQCRPVGDDGFECA